MTHFWDSGYGHAMFGPFMWLFWLVLLVVVIIALRVLSGGAARGDGPGAKQTPLELLEERYARGEIDEEEFERRRRTLRGE